MTKAELRNRLKAERLALSPSAVADKSQAITQHALEVIDWSRVRLAHCYMPMEHSGEVDTYELMAWMGERGLHVTHPAAREITSEELEAQFNLIIVPVLGFDTRCHRLGYGGGFYDRLLAAQPQAQTVGLAYDLSLVVEGLPIEPHDVALGAICTETAMYSSN